MNDNKFITNFKENAEIFNNFFAKQLFLANKNSDLPSQFSKKAHKLLSAIHSTSDDILRIIKNPDKNKTHDHNLISIRIIKICDPSIENTLQN